MSDAIRAEKIAHEVDYAARQLAQAGRLDLTREFIQHGDVTVYAHVTSVARASLSFAERLGRVGISVDCASLLRGALLHDYFLYDWHDSDPSHRLHGFRHPFFALARAEEDFELTPRERNIIVRHMFPLVPVPPTCREAWIVCLADKWCALRETVAGRLPRKDETDDGVSGESSEKRRGSTVETAIDMAFGGATLAACPLSALVLSFAFYGFCGWAWESTVCAMLNHGRFANSGFLLGPCCPIYGVGGIACWFLLRGIPDASSQFVAAALVCSVIEYSAGLLLEKTTGARFWDYSHLPFNLHGRICLYWACAFGLGALCICRVVEPAVLGLLGHLPVLIVQLFAFIVAVAMMVDAACSLASWRRLSDQLERVRTDLADRINESLADASDSMLERIPDSAIDSVAQTHIRSRAVNAWLAELGDATLDALREKASMPTFISDGARGLALAARRVADAAPSVPHPSLARLRAGRRANRPVPSVSLSRRDLRFFNAFPRLRINRYEGVIRATNLRDRAHELFRR